MSASIPCLSKFVTLLFIITNSAICEFTPTALFPFNEFINIFEPNNSEKLDGLPSVSTEYAFTPFTYIDIKFEFGVSIEINSNNCHVLLVVF